MKKRSLFLFGIMTVLSLLFFARPVHAQCLDPTGAPISCPEKERKNTKTSIPPTATFTPTPTLTSSPTATFTPTKTSTFTPTATATSVPFFALLSPSDNDQGRTSSWGIWGIGAGLMALAGLGIYSRLRPKSHALPEPDKPKSFYEEESSARGSIVPVAKEFPEAGEERGNDTDEPVYKRTGVRSFFVDETGILLPPPEDDSGNGSDRGSDDDDDPPMPEI